MIKIEISCCYNTDVLFIIAAPSFSHSRYINIILAEFDLFKVSQFIICLISAMYLEQI